MSNVTVALEGDEITVNFDVDAEDIEEMADALRRVANELLKPEVRYDA